MIVCCVVRCKIRAYLQSYFYIQSWQYVDQKRFSYASSTLQFHAWSKVLILIFSERGPIRCITLITEGYLPFCGVRGAGAED